MSGARRGAKCSLSQVRPDLYNVAGYQTRDRAIARPISGVAREYREAFFAAMPKRHGMRTRLLFQLSVREVLRVSIESPLTEH